VTPEDQRGDSLTLYQDHLPRLCRQHDFHYLDQAPLVFPELDLAVVGSINWYDYSWFADRFQEVDPSWEDRLASKRFSRGRHNDAVFIRWNTDDRQFTRRVVAELRRHLEQALAAVQAAIIVTHHPCFRGLNWPQTEPLSLDGLLWEAYSGNRDLEQVLLDHQDRIPFAFSGHTHRSRENQLGRIRGYNIGGDYHFKRLLVLTWPEGAVAAHEFTTSECSS
jgi:hypothetical protein